MPETLTIQLRQIYYGVGYIVHRDDEATEVFTAASIEDAISMSISRWLSDKPAVWQITDYGFGMVSVRIEVQDQAAAQPDRV